LKHHILLAGHCSANTAASLADFGSTLKLEYLNGLAQTLAPGLLASAPPRTFQNAVEFVSAAAFEIRVLMAIRETGVVFAEPAVFEAGLSFLLKLGTGNGQTRKFWIVSCLAGGVGLAVDRSHASNPALKYFDSDTFHRLVPEHARALTAVDAATLMLVWPSFLVFPYSPIARTPSAIQGFVSAASDDIGIRLGVPEVLSRLIAPIIEHKTPAPTSLKCLTMNVQSEDVVTVVEDLKSSFLPDGMRDKSNSATLLRFLDTQLGSV
jgi:hypothetical protein